jgi:hypothetical protein
MEWNDYKMSRFMARKEKTRDRVKQTPQKNVMASFTSMLLLKT